MAEMVKMVRMELNLLVIPQVQATIKAVWVVLADMEEEVQEVLLEVVVDWVEMAEKVVELLKHTMQTTIGIVTWQD